MKITEVRTNTYNYIKEVVCDWCKEKTRDPHNWSNKNYSFDAGCSIGWKSGSAYPEGSWGNGERVEDLCPTCVKKVLMYLKEQGCTITEFKVDS